MKNILITGGAGFIGLNLARHALKQGWQVTLLDNLSPQIHGSSQPNIPADAHLIIGDICDKAAVLEALNGQDVVVHLAAETGTGQSMYEIARYESVNIGGTAILIDCLVNDPNRQVSKLIVASSRAIYGEGKYECDNCGVVYPLERDLASLKLGIFELKCPICGSNCQSLATSEDSTLHSSSFYGLTKQVQEQMMLMFGRTLGISTFALRYQNVYGPGQSLKNPYTGILAIFSNLAVTDQPINIFEDGLESRDFVYIDDVVSATWLCAQESATGFHNLNVGSGERISVLQVAKMIVNYFGSRSTIQVNGAFRIGDIRHNLADLNRVNQVIGYKPRVQFREGIRKFLDWAATQEKTESRYEQSLLEMQKRGLMGIAQKQ